MPNLDPAVNAETCIGTPPRLRTARALHLRFFQSHRTATVQFRRVRRCHCQRVPVLGGRVAHIRDDELKDRAVLRAGHTSAVEARSHCCARMCLQPRRHVQPHPWRICGRFRACRGAASCQHRHHDHAEEGDHRCYPSHNTVRPSPTTRVIGCPSPQFRTVPSNQTGTPSGPHTTENPLKRKHGTQADPRLRHRDVRPDYHRAMRLYVHGAGRTGADAWPSATREDAVFAELDTTTRAAEQAVALSRIQVLGPASVIAHSFGAVPVLIALRDAHMSIDHLVLVEPALYDIARGDPAIEHHISAMSKARQHAHEGDLVAYWRIVRPLMFGGPFAREKWNSEQMLARRFSHQTPPWGHSIAPEVIEGVHTLVLTGGWNAEYEAIASTLTGHGATRIRLEGNKHRVQDHADFERVVADFITSR